MPNKSKCQTIATSIAKWTGTFASLVAHVCAILLTFGLYFVGVEFDTVLLIITTVLSIEAIFLGIFQQMLNNEIIEQSPDIEL